MHLGNFVMGRASRGPPHRLPLLTEHLEHEPPLDLVRQTIATGAISP